MRVADEMERRQSVLLESLLTPQPELNEVRVRNTDAEREAVGRRLGPALHRCRQRTRSQVGRDKRSLIPRPIAIRIGYPASLIVT